MSYPAPVLPENAPFAASERAWLDGWLAAYFGSQVVARPGATAAAPEAEPIENFPWHDMTLPIEERAAPRRGPAARRAADGGDGAAGLRPMRLSVPELCRSDRRAARRRASAAAFPAARRPRGC